MIDIVKILTHQKGLLFRNGEFAGLLDAGRHWLFGRTHVEVVSQRDPWLTHRELDVIVKSGAGGPGDRTGPEGLRAGAGVD